VTDEKNTIRTSVCLDEALMERVVIIAERTGETKATIMRHLLRAGTMVLPEQWGISVPWVNNKPVLSAFQALSARAEDRAREQAMARQEKLVESVLRMAASTHGFVPQSPKLGRCPMCVTKELDRLRLADHCDGPAQGVNDDTDETPWQCEVCNTVTYGGISVCRQCGAERM
jgi:hypothetical protein